MRLNVEKLNAAVVSLLSKRKGNSWSRPTFHQVLHQGMVGGVRLAPWMPFGLLLVGALGDYENMRQYLLTATTDQMSRTVLLSIAGGFVFGAIAQVLVDIATPKLWDENKVSSI